MNNINKTRCLVLATLCVFLLGVSVRALDPNQPASSFLRTHFTTDDGLSGSVVDQIVQTQDGFLWLVINGINLARFDGKSFHLFDKPLAWSLAVAPNGDLWVGTLQDLRHIPASSLNQFTITESTSYHPGPGKESDIVFLRFTRNGVLWVATSGGLFRYDGDQFVPVGPRVLTRNIDEAPDGNLLVINKDGFMELKGSEVVPHPKLAAQLGVKDDKIFHVLKDRRGNIWYCTANGVARETGGRIEKWGPKGRGALRAYEDAQGTIWIGKEEGLFRVTATGLELVVPGMQVRSIYGDRDGNLWVGTNGDGLYRFKDRAVRMFTTEDGLPNDLLMTVIAARDGSVWTGANCGGLARFDGTRFQTYNEKNGLPNTCVWAIAEDANRDLWIGTWGGGAFRYHNGAFLTHRFTFSSNTLHWFIVSLIGLISLGLLLGYLTSILTTIACAAAIANLVLTDQPIDVVYFFRILTSAALFLLGPGAYSVDARLFGLRVTVVPPRKDKNSATTLN